VQSTAFALAAGLLNLLLRNNHARTRYWIWLTASLKFLIPFSIFVELGHRLTWSSAPVIAQPRLAISIDTISQPFIIATSAPVVSTPATPSMLLPAIWPQLEPGVFGVFRPVLYLPAGIADHLDDAQLKAIVAHELCHIRRRDNLTAALHMLVEAVFWFHPLIWWIGTRLVDERERACDEEVVQSGSDPEVYAEGRESLARISKKESRQLWSTAYCSD
jgi:beta-lactamase regulating signal transducer with metallopeptidase domain